MGLVKRSMVLGEGGVIVGVGFQIKLIIKTSPMIRSIRMNPRPHLPIAQEIIYYHDLPNDQHSEASFLKHSETSHTPTDSHIFAHLYASIAQLEARSQAKLKQLRWELVQKDQGKGAKRTEGVAAGRALIEDKENLQVTYREIVGLGGESPQKDGNFEMDEHRNYVRSIPGPLASSNTSSRGTRELFSLQQSRELSPKQTQPKQGNFAHLRSNSEFHQKSDQFSNKREKEKSSGRKSQRSEKKARGQSVESEGKGRGRIYEEILSLYSTAKLLAMEQRKKL